MSDGKDEGTSSWYKVPTWDGSPLTWRSFRREMDWWVSSLDLESTRKFNLAARWLLRQSGPARQRGEEFTPKELEYKRAVKSVDTEGTEIIIEEEDLLFGLNKLLDALEGINGRTVLDKRGELRSQFYLELARKPGERLSEFCSRFRTAVADLKAEGVVLPDSELGWFLKEKIGLDPLKKQLLDTALAGKEEYSIIEAESLRLFKDLHASDPLFRKPGASAGKFFQRRSLPGMASSSSPSIARPGSSSTARPRTSSTSSFPRFSGRPGVPQRQVHLTEQDEGEPEAEDGEMYPDEDGDADAMEAPPSLEEVLQTEAEVLAAELERAAEDGADDEVLEGVEASVEAGAEALVSMREARTRLQAVRKDRGYRSQAPTSGAKGEGRGRGIGGAALRKQSGKHPCFDCGEHGHWAGDSACKHPGEGLGRKKDNQSARPKARQVRVAEHQAQVMEYDIGGHANTEESHEALVVVHGDLEHALYQDALISSSVGRERVPMELVGALDSACNRTCCGSVWLQNYLDALSGAPAFVRNLIREVPESEAFRFGNGSSTPSFARWRLPALLDQKIFLFWVSVVDVRTLGLLLGRDLMEALGIRLDFERKLLDCRRLGVHDFSLEQMRAGHFMLPLLPHDVTNGWGEEPRFRFKRLGLDGVVELALTHRVWLSNMLQTPSLRVNRGAASEFHVTESSLRSAALVLTPPRAAFEDPFAPPRAVLDDQIPAPTARASALHVPSGPEAIFHGGGRRRWSSSSSRQMASHGRAASRQSPLARSRSALMALATTLLAVFAFSFPVGGDSHRLASASGEYAGSWLDDQEVLRWSEDDSRQPLGDQLAKKPFGSEARFSRRSIAGRDVDVQAGQGSLSESSSSSGKAKGSQGGCRAVGPRRGGSNSSWSPRWSSDFEIRPHQVGGACSGARGGKGHCGDHQEEDSTYDRSAAWAGDPKFGSSGGSGILNNAIDCKNVSDSRHGLLGPYGFIGGFGIDSPYDIRPHTSLTRCVHDVCATHCLGDRGPPERHNGQHGVQHAGDDASAGRQVSDDVGAGVSARGGHNRVGDGRQHGVGTGVSSEPRTAGFVGAGGGSSGVQRSSVGLQGCPRSINEAAPDYHFAATPLKAGVKQMISQAWQRHRKQQLAVSVSRKQANEAMLAEETATFVNDTFVAHLAMPAPSFAEVFTDTEPVLQQAQLRGHRTLEPFTLKTGWDFRLAQHRTLALESIKRSKPYMVIIAFPCGPWSPLQQLNAERGLLLHKRKEARLLADFAAAVAQLQLSRRCHFVIENPDASLAWQLPSLASLANDPRVLAVRLDQCRYGLRPAAGARFPVPIGSTAAAARHRKRTRLLTSSQAVVSTFIGKLCRGTNQSHFHVPVFGGKAVTTRAGQYPIKFAKAILQATEEQFDHETMCSWRAARVEPHEVNAVDGELDDDGGGLDFHLEVSDDEEAPVQANESKILIPKGVRQAVKRLHENTGHRSPARLARALLVCGAPTEAVIAAKQLDCDVCRERRQPKTRKPASLPAPRDVGEQVHIDLVVIEDGLRRGHCVVHVVDSVSRFQAAAVIDDKSSASVCRFLLQHWMPLMGVPRVVVADQGREFISAEFSEFLEARSVFLYHTAVQAPFQNGVCERAGGVLKALTGAIVAQHAVLGRDDMANAVAEAVAAYNSDVNDMGTSPLQAVTGRQALPLGDTLADFGRRLAEHSLVSERPSLARQVAMRETARISMVRLHYSKALRRAELARARRVNVEELPEPGDIVFFWRQTKMNPRKKDAAAATTPRRRRVELRRWHGPALMVAMEARANGGGEPGGCCFLSYRGQITKCAVEHVRKGSSLEQIASGDWEEAIKEVIEDAERTRPSTEAGAMGDGVIQADGDVLDVEPQASTNLEASLPASVGMLSPGEIVEAMSVPPSRRSSMVLPGTPASGTAAPGTPVQDLLSRIPRRLPQGRSFQQTLTRARSLDEAADSQGVGRGFKRSASGPAEEMEREAPAAPFSSIPEVPAMSSQLQPPQLLEESLQPPEGPLQSVTSPAPQQPPQLLEESRQPPEGSTETAAPRGLFEALILNNEQLERLGHDDWSHPLLQVQAQAELDRRFPLDAVEYELGSWDGRWSLMCERTWQLRESLGLPLPVGVENEALAAQAARREFVYSKLSEEHKVLFDEAAVAGWKAYVDNDAVEVLSPAQSAKVRQELARKGELDRIMKPRFVLVDKHEPLRTKEHDLPIKASARLVVPGYKDHSNLNNLVRRDAPTGSRIAQHLLFMVAAFHTSWHLMSGDVKAAFLKGDEFINRELYLSSTDIRNNPGIPLQPGQLARVKKGIFGLSDAPRLWWTRLSRCLAENGWERSQLDQALWFRWKTARSGKRELSGILVAHVDDLLLAGDDDSRASFDKVGSELGYGSVELGDFVWCGKRIRRAEDGTIRLSMVEYHRNLKEAPLPANRRRDPDAPLTDYERRQLRAVLGSLQWLVAQLRFDMAFTVSTLQSAEPTVRTLVRANAAVRAFRQDCNFELTFRPIDYRTAGLMVVTDASLGSVKLNGSCEGNPQEKVYSQACYFVILADHSLMSGKPGQFNILDARSHRIPRVCRSSYSAELLGAEEAFDVGLLCRGFMASLRDQEVVGKFAEKALASTPLTVIVDAKDVHDKGNSDTGSYGTQKSLAFTVAWLRSVLRRPGTSLKWTATENMWVDAGAKDMDLTHMRTTMKEGKWCVTYSPDFVKQVSKGAKRRSSSTSPTPSTSTSIPGEAIPNDDPILGYVLKFSRTRGWHSDGALGVNVAQNARSFRTPEPRFASSALPYRTTFGSFESGGKVVWRALERSVKYVDLPNQHALLERSANDLVTFFHALPSSDLQG